MLPFSQYTIEIGLKRLCRFRSAPERDTPSLSFGFYSNEIKINRSMRIYGGASIIGYEHYWEAGIFEITRHWSYGDHLNLHVLNRSVSQIHELDSTLMMEECF